jgi:PAS domain S-box-containing protein
MIKLLLVDDKTENIYLLQSMLDTNGFKTISAKNGAEALGLLRTIIPDLIISDILMPVMDGFTLCRECKKDEMLKNIPFFFYTATYLDAKDEEYALSLGADRFILKPQEPDVFLKIITDFLGDVKNKTIHPKAIIQQDEIIVLKEYNDVLIRKLEDKMLQSEKSEKELRRYSLELEKEILERKNNEISLQKSQNLFHTLAEASPVGIFRTNPDGYTTYVNPKWEELSGLSSKKAFGNGWLNAVHPDDREKLSESWVNNYKSKKESSAEYRFLRPDGSLVWVIGKAVPEIISNEVSGYIGTITDITGRKLSEVELIKAKEKAEENDRLKTAFLHNISHEVRTPMNSIVGFSDLITDPDLTQETRNEFIQTIVQSSNQLLSIITQIVSMATIEAGQEKTYEKEISLNSIFKMVSDQFSSEAERKKIILGYNTGLATGEDKINTDETKLIQIISNLVGNALKFIKKGSINFGYVVKDKYLEFYVRDTGIGIPPDMHEKIFERFRQVETSLSREYEGAGLGLSISKAYVELLGGKIWLTSNLGEGSVFYFTIPYHKVSLNVKSKEEVFGKQKSDLEKTITILVAEDETTNFKLLAHYLSNDNIAVLQAANGSEAVEICKKNKQIDLVLMDLKMPVMDGFEATKRIKEFRPDLPVIAQTAYERDVDKTKAISYGCSDFITKPFKKEELLTIIQKYLAFD